MRINLNLVPWMSLLGILGAGIGYLIGPGEGGDPTVPALYGLCVGSMAGIATRLVVRAYTRRHESDKGPPT